MIRQLAHLCFFTDNLSEMIEFYHKTLELKIKFTLENSEDKTFGYYFECGHSTFIEVFDRKMATKQWSEDNDKLNSNNHFRHLCFEVIQLNEFKSKLELSGLKVSEITTGMDNSRQAWINDPDGNSIELMEYTYKSFQL